MNGEAFLRSAVGDQGYEALANAAQRLPELEAVILPRVAIAWLHMAAEIGSQGHVIGTSALLKAESIEFDGQTACLKTEFPAAAALLCMAAGCVDLALPSRLEPRHVARLAKSVELMTKARFLKRVKEMEAASRSAEGSQTSTPGQSDAEESSLNKGLDMPGKAAAPRGPEKPTAPAPQTKQGAAQQQPREPIGTQGTKKLDTP